MEQYFDFFEPFSNFSDLILLLIFLIFFEFFGFRWVFLHFGEFFPIFGFLHFYVFSEGERDLLFFFEAAGVSHDPIVHI